MNFGTFILLYWLPIKKSYNCAYSQNWRGYWVSKIAVNIISSSHQTYRIHINVWYRYFCEKQKSPFNKLPVSIIKGAILMKKSKIWKFEWNEIDAIEDSITSINFPPIFWLQISTTESDIESLHFWRKKVEVFKMKSY